MFNTAKKFRSCIFSLCTAVVLCMSLTVSSNSVADVVNIRSDAPTTYVVKKGDTLWDISSLFLDEPWLWPELWRNNTQIENPHLIYPGDQLFLRYNEQGEPVIELVRDKATIVLTPIKRKKEKPNPISVLPWSSLAPFIENGSLVAQDYYESLPRVLGDKSGSPIFSTTDYVLTHNVPSNQNDYQIVRKVRQVTDSSGKVLGLQVSHLSDATVNSELANNRQLVKLTGSSREARQGDRVMPKQQRMTRDLQLQAASQQIGEIVQNANGHSLIGQRDIVIINLGRNQVSEGTVFGIYQQGPNITSVEDPKYVEEKSVLDVFSSDEEIQQPALKVGELIVVKSFANASYAWVTKSTTHLRGKELIAKP